MDAEKGTQEREPKAIEPASEQDSRTCLGCGAKTDEAGALPCGH